MHLRFTIYDLRFEHKRVNHKSQMADLEIHTPGFFRLFLAVAVPPEVRNEIARAQGQLQRQAPPGTIRWTRPEQFHVTLKFLGDVPKESVPALQNAVAEVCAKFPPLRLSADGIGFFPNDRKPRVIWAGAKDRAEQLPELHRQISEALRWLGPAEKLERFSAHITLGRFKPGKHGSLVNLMKRIAMVRARHFGDWAVSAVELIRSELNSTGALHFVQAQFPLRSE
jgi:RNA 2',3'-cyclic 3'-phosphodiesterase